MVSRFTYIIGALALILAVSPISATVATAGSPTDSIRASRLSTFTRPNVSRYRYNKRGIERDANGTDVRVLRNGNYRNLDGSIRANKEPQEGSIGRNLIRRQTKRAQRRSRGIPGTVTRRSMDNGNRGVRYRTSVDEIPADCSLSSRSRRTRCEYKRKTNDRFR